jgi:hypothetical protein
MTPLSIRWPEIVATSWQDFTKALEPCLDAYKGHVQPVYVFRGQANASWSLEPSLLRHLRTVSDPAAARKIEELLETEFLAQSSLFPETQSVWVALAAAGRIEQWAFMQHHGCPTRLLDWTASAYVAAYFAVDQLPKCDGALYVVGAAALDQHWANIDRGPVSISSDELVDPTTHERVVFTWPQLRSQRLAIQQGHFSVSTKLLSAHDGPILSACASVASDKSERVIHRKIIIASDLKLVILQQLRAMNIAPHALFPSLDGFGRSLADLARLKATLAQQNA